MTHATGTIVSVRAGRVRPHDGAGVPGRAERTWRTAYWKDAVDGPVHVGPLGLAGDEQADQRHHGGPHRAVLAYAAAHYPRWRAELGIADMGPGGFAENLTIDGPDEHAVCVGDVFAIGDVRLQVTQPRGPCASIARRWQRADMVKLVSDASRFGWYLRVLAEGVVERGMEVQRIEHPHPALDVAYVFRLRHDPELDPAIVGRLAELPELTPDLREKFVAHRARLGA